MLETETLYKFIGLLATLVGILAGYRRLTQERRSASERAFRAMLIEFSPTLRGLIRGMKHICEKAQTDLVTTDPLSRYLAQEIENYRRYSQIQREKLTENRKKYLSALKYDRRFSAMLRRFLRAIALSQASCEEVAITLDLDRKMNQPSEGNHLSDGELERRKLLPVQRSASKLSRLIDKFDLTIKKSRLEHGIADAGNGPSSSRASSP